MHFLLSNDDGYQAIGIRKLARALEQFGEVTVVAPDRDRSGASNSLTLDIPLQVRTDDTGFNYVNGTPTDCVHLALTGLLNGEPDMVISGINAGSNLGDDVHYSGTVAAAMEGRFLGRTALAISLAGAAPVHFDAAVKISLRIVRALLSHPIEAGLLLNINIPDVPYERQGRMEVTRLGNRHKSEPAIKMKDPKNRDIYWIGPAGPGADAGPGTDFHAIQQGNISITPLQFDLTRHGVLNDLKIWLAEFD
jgi:5'-nucleotidase